MKWYVDESLAMAEIKMLENHPFYLGSKFAVPSIGNYLVSEPTLKNFVLIHDESGIKAVSNISRHRQSLLLNGHGTKKQKSPTPCITGNMPWMEKALRLTVLTRIINALTCPPFPLPSGGHFYLNKILR